MTASRSFGLDTWVLSVSLMQLVADAQFLKVIYLFLMSTFCAATSDPAPVIVTFPFTSKYESL